MKSRLDELFAPYPEHLSVPELADILGVRPSTAYRWLQAGIVPAYKVGKTWVILRDEVRDLLASGRTFRGGSPPRESPPDSA